MDRADVHLGNPVVRGPLTVFPVFNGCAVARTGYHLHEQPVTVAEREGSPVVDELVATNAGARPALVLEGELLEGGWQHRVAGRSVMLAADSSLALKVRCVEQGRWSGVGVHERKGRRAPITVRVAEGQHAVWERVARYGASPTGSLLDTTRGLDRAAEELVAGLRPLPFQAGVLIGVGGQPLVLEVFDCPGMLAQVWDELLRAAAIDTQHAPAVATPGRRARRFVQRTTAVALEPAAAGIGIAGRGRTSHARVSTLVWHARAVHTVAVNVQHPVVAA